MDTVPTNRTGRDIDITDSRGLQDIGESSGPLDGGCDRPGCTRKCIGRFCEYHNSSSPGGSITGFEPSSSSPDIFGDPSRRELQRQMDRLEGKVDALLAALELDVDE